MKRNLHDDLAICEAASLGKYYASAEEWPGNANLRHWVSDHYDGIGCFIRYEDARFDAEAREGWPEAIKRAINAETELREATTRLRELEVLFVTEEDKRCHYEALADKLALENERYTRALSSLISLIDGGYLIRAKLSSGTDHVIRIAKEAITDGTN